MDFTIGSSMRLSRVILTFSPVRIIENLGVMPEIFHASMQGNHSHIAAAPPSNKTAKHHETSCRPLLLPCMFLAYKCLFCLFE
jgi:hypothetical protein